MIVSSAGFFSSPGSVDNDDACLDVMRFAKVAFVGAMSVHCIKELAR